MRKCNLQLQSDSRARDRAGERASELLSIAIAIAIAIAICKPDLSEICCVRFGCDCYCWLTDITEMCNWQPPKQPRNEIVKQTHRPRELSTQHSALSVEKRELPVENREQSESLSERHCSRNPTNILIETETETETETAAEIENKSPRAVQRSSSSNIGNIQIAMWVFLAAFESLQSHTRKNIGDHGAAGMWLANILSTLETGYSILRCRIHCPPVVAAGISGAAVVANLAAVFPSVAAAAACCSWPTNGI
ncbi:GM18931 [Drosophila sechellia]|uniref:GM18931 n=1 Tax=Drosophila sechellia TaxID=7238 RepID=B4I9M1_DROSE|nr:GM18931 [Drosophila sechellia]